MKTTETIEKRHKLQEQLAGYGIEADKKLTMKTMQELIDLHRNAVARVEYARSFMNELALVDCDIEGEDISRVASSKTDFCFFIGARTACEEFLAKVFKKG